jgi:hypothetical protein
MRPPCTWSCATPRRAGARRPHRTQDQTCPAPECVQPRFVRLSAWAGGGAENAQRRPAHHAPEANQAAGCQLLQPRARRVHARHLRAARRGARELPACCVCACVCFAARSRTASSAPGAASTRCTWSARPRSDSPSADTSAPPSTAWPKSDAASSSGRSAAMLALRCARVAQETIKRDAEQPRRQRSLRDATQEGGWVG